MPFTEPCLSPRWPTSLHLGPGRTSLNELSLGSRVTEAEITLER